MKIEFTKMHSNHRRLRNDSIVGHCDNLPKVGECFVFFGEPIDKAKDFRIVNTSVVISLKKNDDEFTITTTSGSTYKVKYA